MLPKSISSTQETSEVMDCQVLLGLRLSNVWRIVGKMKRTLPVEHY
jgi:hypothetical protein